MYTAYYISIKTKGTLFNYYIFYKGVDTPNNLLYYLFNG